MRVDVNQTHAVTGIRGPVSALRCVCPITVLSLIIRSARVIPTPGALVISTHSVSMRLLQAMAPSVSGVRVTQRVSHRQVCLVGSLIAVQIVVRSHRAVAGVMVAARSAVMTVVLFAVG